MKRILIFALVVGLAPALLAAAEQPASLKVLFLGDKGHHNPADRAKQLIPALAPRGIDVTYTGNPDDLNPATLAKYDALIVYANIDAITPAQAKALLDYVDGGGGFVPIHCASYCFRNSPEYVALVGAQFLRHGTGEFDTRVVDPDHPIMKGFVPFRTWDETYVHTKPGKDRHILQARAEGNGEEPWTWVRTQGKGRVFYTAYGHDARTFGNPGFQALIERGIRWAANKGPVVDGRTSARPDGDKAVQPLLTSGVLSDPDAQVRLAALLALAEYPESEAAGTALVETLAGGRADGDRWLGDAATSAAAAHALPFLKALALHDFREPPAGPIAAIAGRVAEHYARGGPVESVGGLVIALGGAHPIVRDAVVAGLARGWPEGLAARLGDADAALSPLLATLAPDRKGQLVMLAARWGSRALEKDAGAVAAALLAVAGDATRPDAARVDAARQLVELRKQDASPALALLALITPRTSPTLAAGLLVAVGRSTSPAIGPALAARLPTLTPAVVPSALRTLLDREDWTGAFLDAAEQGKVSPDLLSLDQKQALAAHPDTSLAARARRLLERGGGLPDPDRQKVIDALADRVLRAGDPARGKLVFKEQCAKCHTHSGEGGKVGPDLTGMAAHPKAELLVQILDPSRSVEGNFVQYTVVTKEGRVLTGLLASESRTSVELIDTEGKSHPLLRDDIDELMASRKSLMPDGFEKQVPPEALADLLEFLALRGKYLPLDLRKAATIVSTLGMFLSKDDPAERLIFRDWSPKSFEGVPFLLVDPQGDRVPNVVLLHGPLGTFPPRMPRSVSLPCHAPARAIHLLSGVSGWGAMTPNAPHTVSMIVRVRYADGVTEDHPLRNGVEFADYIRPIDVPGSKLAFRLRDQQIRYLAVLPRRTEVIDRIDLVKGPDHTAPVVMAVTLEGYE